MTKNNIAKLNVNQLTNSISIGLFVLLFISVFFRFDGIFNSYVSSKLLLFYLTLGSLFILAAIKSFFYKKVRIRFDWFDFVFLLFLIWNSIRYYNYDSLFSFDSKIIILCTLFFLYYISKQLLINPQCCTLFKKVLIICFLTLSITQAAIGILQAHGFLDSLSPQFKITGSFANPALFSIFIAALYPFSLYCYLFRKQNGNPSLITNLSLLSLFLFFIAIPLTGNRVSWISTFLSTIILLFFRFGIKNSYKRFFQKKYIIILLLVVTALILALISYHLFYYKEGSSLGRLLIWKICWGSLSRYFFFGIGYGGFESSYNLWQAEYFAMPPNSFTEEQLADYVGIAYNEYFQIFIESGVVGLAIFMVALLMLLKSVFIRFSQEKKSPPSIYIAFAVSFFAFLVMAIFSYPFQQINLVCLFIILLSFLSINSCKSFYLKCNKTFFILSLFILSFLSIYPLNELPSLKKWHQANSLYQNMMFGEAEKMYEQASYKLQNNGLFLQYYGKCLELNEKNEKSIEILNRALKYRTDQLIYISLASNYLSLKDYNKAEQSLLFAINLIPNRLYPRYLLAKVYFESNQYEKANIYAKQAQEMAIKVNSQAVEEMKRDIQFIIKETNDNH